MSIIRAARPQSNFYILDKRISEDRNLSWAARGLLVFLLGKPDHWEISVEHLRKETENSDKATGRDGVYTLIKALRKAGYVKRFRARTADGLLDGYDYVVYDEPITLGEAEDEDEPCTSNPYTAEPSTANPTLVSNDVKQVSKKARIQLDIGWLPKESWDGFVEMRQRIRKPLTDRAKGMILKKLEAFRDDGMDVGEILDNSTLNSWQDVYAPKVEQKAEIKPKEQAWWASDQGILAKAAQIGLTPRSGESWHDLKGRINQRLGQ